MDFLKLIQSLDELLYEIMSWLIFYPVTLWRTLTKPLTMMTYSEVELGIRPSGNIPTRCHRPCSCC
jgi:hypothetical protein